MSFQWNEGVAERIKRGARAGVQACAEEILSTGNQLILDPPKTGRIYTTFFYTRGTGAERSVHAAGTRSPHQASAPGEAPASDSGELIAQSRVEVSGTTYSASAVWFSRHATMLQYGTDRMAPRPFATMALSLRAQGFDATIQRFISLELVA